MIATSEYSSVQFNALIRACDHRVCCNINTACPFGPFYVIPITRTSGTMHPGARQRARVWAVATDPRKRWPPRPGECVQVPQQLEPEATTKKLKSYISFSFFPPLSKNLNRSTQIRVQPHSACLLHFPKPTAPASAPARAAV